MSRAPSLGLTMPSLIDAVALTTRLAQEEKDNSAVFMENS